MSSFSDDERQTRLRTLRGFSCGLGAFAFWGFFPLYIYLLKDRVSVGELIAHRIIWSGLLALAIVAWRNRLSDFFHETFTPTNFVLLFISAFLLVTNWYVYVFAIFVEAVLEVSLGYYLLPLLMAFLGFVVLREPLHRLEIVAIVISAIGIGALAISEGRLPWISLAVGISFAIYGMMRKRMKPKPLEGICGEMIIATPCALTWIVALHLFGENKFLTPGNADVSWLLLGLSVASVLPLVLFYAANNVLRYVTLGFMSYVGPSLIFLVATFILKEPFTPVLGFTFLCIWVALVIFSWSGLRKMTAKPHAPGPR